MKDLFHFQSVFQDCLKDLAGSADRAISALAGLLSINDNGVIPVEGRINAILADGHAEPLSAVELTDAGVAVYVDGHTVPLSDSSLSLLPTLASILDKICDFADISYVESHPVCDEIIRILNESGRESAIFSEPVNATYVIEGRGLLDFEECAIAGVLIKDGRLVLVDTDNNHRGSGISYTESGECYLTEFWEQNSLEEIKTRLK